MNTVVRLLARLGLVESMGRVIARPDGGAARLELDQLQVWPGSGGGQTLRYCVIASGEPSRPWQVTLQRGDGVPEVITHEMTRRAAQQALAAIAGLPRKRIGWGGALAGVCVVVILGLSVVRTPLADPPKPTPLSSGAPSMPTVAIPAPAVVSPTAAPELSVSLEDMLACDTE